MPRSAAKKSPPPAATSGTKRRLEFDEVADDSSIAVAAERRSKVAKTPAAARRDKTQTTILTSFSSPVSKQTDKRSKIVTPEEEKKQDDNDETAARGFVPKYIHKNLSYYCQGDSKLDPITQSAFEQVMESHVIPQDLEQSRSYGPKSGSSFEDRVLAAYTLGQLTPRDDFQGDRRICTACAKKGHKRDACPTLI